MVNHQPPSSRLSDPDNLQVHSIFYTIQGEGPFSGHPAIFIRLSGCNLQCPHCDTNYTIPTQTLSVHDILKKVGDLHPEEFPLVVVTGGEPFRQNIGKLIKYLHICGHPVQIETNGTLPPSWGVLTSDNYFREHKVYIVCSPKTDKIHPDLIPYITAFKYVINADSVNEDGLPVSALNHPVKKQVYRPENKNIPIYIQPEDSQDDEQNKRNIQATINSCKKFGYIMQLQIHKIIGVE